MSLATLVGTWAAPPDLPAKVALGLALGVGLAAARGGGKAVLEDRRFLPVTALAAALLSVVYVSVYLRGGPRIVDATTYFLQGRLLSHGTFTFVPPEPSASFRGRFLVDHDGALGGLFPPGYPLLLALGFLVGAPMVIGPALAAGLVYATHRLGRAVARELGLPAEPVARGAALFSVACAALRYHTADTMSHGATALGITVALAAILEARSTPRAPGHLAGGRGAALVAGLALGGVIATRPVSALAVGAVVLALARGRRVPVLLGLVPGVLFLLVGQHAVTGQWLASSQRLYYATSDGPPDCFRYGFGAGIGCVHEHGDFVQARLAGGYGLVAALGTSLRRLHAHLLDVANLEPLALLVLVPLVRLRRRGVIRALGALLAGHLLAYAPFYFDGDYPGGGARFFADVLPVEHVLVVVALAALRPARFVAHLGGAIALALLGFAVHASYQHGQLRDRDGGRPMFEPDVLAQAAVRNGLVFVDTDHGFALGHDPGADPHRAVLVARRRGDDRDRLLYERLGRPATWRYERVLGAGPHGSSDTRLVPWAPPESGAELRFEAEAEWPPLAQAAGFAVPAWGPACASERRVLTLTPSAASARATIALPVPSSGRWAVTVHVVRDVTVPFAPSRPGDGRPRAAVAVAGSIFTDEGEPQTDGARTTPCLALPSREVALHAPAEEMTIEADGGAVSIDYVSMSKIP